jgi:glycerol-3-phosphate dehydrogenase (NAD(P)+)
MNIAILGAGAWGTALAISLAQRHAIALWSNVAAEVQAMRAARTNERYLPGCPIPAQVALVTELDEAVAAAELVLIATPVAALREVVSSLAALGATAPIVCACKGFESSSARLPHEIIAEAGPAGAPVAVLSGPSFAQEVARGLPAAVTLAAADPAFACTTARALHHSTLRVYYTDDLIGVEIGGAVKNVMAIATGICEGLGLGLNARAALITRGLAEITRLGTSLGGRAETFMGLAGAGDLILTCTGELSRNRRVGLELARGKSLPETLAALGHVAEGVHSACEVERIAQQHAVDMPITEAVCAVLFRGLAPQAAVQILLARDPKIEA